MVGATNCWGRASKILRREFPPVRRPLGTVQYWIAPKPTRMQHTVMDNTMTLPENPPDSLQDARWLAWERKNRREDRIAERRMKLVFVVVGVILLILILRALLKASQQCDLVGKGSTVACLWRNDPSRYRLESGNVWGALRGG
jgi:hypothetical protein